MRTIVYLIFASLLLAGTATANVDTAGGDEHGTTPYCQEGQGERVSSNGAVAALRNAGVARVCEGEQWEGNDPVSGQGCNAANPQTVAVNACPNTEGDASLYPNQNKADKAGELGVRASQGSYKGRQAAFVALEIGGVGTVKAYTDGETSAVYLQDYSETLGVTCIYTNNEEDCNALASIVHDAGVTQGSAVGEEREANCTVSEYGAQRCTRDNTAVTVTVPLVP